jgi:hypothetical protein
MEPITLETLTQLVATVGVPTALVIFFVWQSNLREARSTDRMMHLEEFIKTTLLTTVEKTTTAIAQNTTVLAECMKTTQDQRITTEKMTVGLDTVHKDLMTHCELAEKIAKKFEVS